MINTNENNISVAGQFTVNEFHRFLAVMHGLVNKRGYQKIFLDFSQCTLAFPGPMLAICSQLSKLREEGFDINLVLPKNEKLYRLFKNSNWAHIIDPMHFDKSGFKGLGQVPTTQFTNIYEQAESVNSIMDVILGSLTGFTRGDLAAIEWSLNEITDNVINHSESSVGGFVQLSTFQKNRKRIEYVVCDAGIGIPNSLRQGRPELISDSDALDQAIREGVAKNKTTNQNNGLFGAFQISRISEGYIQIHSGNACLNYNKKDGLQIRGETVPFNGTLIMACIDYSNPGLLGEALNFGRKQHYPVDFIETKFKNDHDEKLIFIMKEEASSFGSRKSAESIYIKLKNLIKVCGNCKIFVDFDDVAVISSSFADEVFGKLFAEMGPLVFMQKFEFSNTCDTVRSLIDRSIILRCASPK